MENLKSKAFSGFIWRLMQDAMAQIVNFIVSIYLGRLLMPSDYGLVAMISIFITIASVFVDTGFSSSVVRKKDLSDIDLSTLFWSSISASLIIYLLLYFSAPSIASFYNENSLILLLRLESITIVIASLYSVQNSLLQREFQFKKSFIVRLNILCKSVNLFFWTIIFNICKTYWRKS